MPDAPLVHTAGPSGLQRPVRGMFLPDGTELLRVSEGWIDSRVVEVGKWLKRYDPLLSLRAEANRFREVNRYHLLRYEEGEFVTITHFTPAEVSNIPNVVRRMDQSVSGHEPLNDRLDKMRKAREQHYRDWFLDGARATYEHLLAYAMEAEEGKSFHGMAGFGEGKLGG